MTTSSRILNAKWKPVEKRRQWYEMYGENASILARAARGYKPKPLPPHESIPFHWLLNQRYKVPRYDIPKFSDYGNKDLGRYGITDKVKKALVKRFKKD